MFQFLENKVSLNSETVLIIVDEDGRIESSGINNILPANKITPIIKILTIKLKNYFVTSNVLDSISLPCETCKFHIPVGA